MIAVLGPYYDPDVIIRRWRREHLTEYTQHLLNQGKAAWSPVTYGCVFDESETQVSRELWEEFSKTFLPVCTEAHILMLQGWQRSIGLDVETKLVREHKIELVYIDPKDYSQLIMGDPDGILP